MEQYTSLYRKLRPVRFDEIVGQSHISRIMINALTLGRVGHAYLFSGPRGTGKTTTAKILAKAVNCLEPDGAEPCNQCASCLRIASGRSLDVMEIDGASNRGIDEIRDLREKVRLAPAEEKCKVYIIDEVHMLTGEAFNALLKTLEEPPARVLFVLATTEPHKVPETIISRCLRFDFRRISQGEIIQYLKNVAQLQDIHAEDQALTLIAKIARGGLRDALSVFEQCMAFNGERITQADVEAVVGKAGDRVIKDLFDCILAGDVAGSLGIIEECVAKGSDIGTIFNDVLEYLRNMLLLSAAGEAVHLVPYGREIVEEMERQSRGAPRERLFEMADIAAGYARQVRWTSQPQIILELAVIKLCEFGLPGAGQEAGSAGGSLSQSGGKAFQKPEDRPPETAEKDEPLKFHDPARHETAATAEEVETPELPGPQQQEGTQLSQPSEPLESRQEPPVSPEEPGSLSLASIEKEWDTILMKKLKKQMISLHALMVEGVPVDYKDHVLTIGFGSKFKFHKETVEQSKNKKQLESFLRQHFGQDIRLKFVMKDKGQAAPEEEKQEAPGTVDKQDIVKKALEIFGGELVPIEDIDMGDSSPDEEGF